MKTLKKISLAVVLLGLMCILLVGLGTTASAATSGKLKYEVSDGEAIITGFSPTAFTKPKDVEIPDTINDYPVTAIADEAFEDESITSVIIPDSVITIGDYAFDECEKLASVTLGNSVESIGESAFRNCNDITILTIPESVKSIGNCAFSECSDFTNIYWNAKNAEIGYDVFANAGRNGTGIDVVFGNNVEKIPSYIFTASSNIKSITIGNSVKTIADYAFNCSVQNGSINIPESVTSIGNCALSGFHSAVTINNPECEIYNSEGTLGYGATIYGCCGSTAQKYADNYKRTFVGIGHYYKSKVTEPICTEKGYTTYICACGDSYVADYTSPAHINNNSDMYCDLCGEMIIDIFEYSIDDNEVSITGFDSSIGGYVVIPETIEGYPVTSIRGMAFQMCFDVKTVIIPKSVTTIEGFAFALCPGIERIAIFNKDCDIWDMSDVFASQTTIYGYEGSTAQEYAEKYDRTFINIKNSGIENPILQYLSYRIEYGEVTITEFDKDFSGDVVIPGKIDGYPVTAFDDWAFRDCSFISVTIPESVINIGEEAFWDCRALETVTIENGVTNIGNRAFWSCESLKSVTIPGSVISIGEDAFSECRALETVTIENGVTSIGNGAFWYCESLTNVTIPDSITSIGDNAFRGCSSLQNIIISAGVTTIKDCLFADCSSLTNVTLPDGVTSIGASAFYNCSKLTDIIIPDSVTSIEMYALGRCFSLTSVTFPESVKYIGENVFYGSNSISKVTIKNPDCVIYNKDETIHPATTIYGYCGSTAQKYADNYKRNFVRIGHNYTPKVTEPTCTEQGYTTYTCSECGDVKISDYISKINHIYTYSNSCDMCGMIRSSIFRIETNNKEVTITSCLESFFGKVIIPETIYGYPVTGIAKKAFYGCTGVSDIIIPDSVITIGSNAFDDTEYYKNIANWENGVLYIGKHLIDAKTDIETCTIKEGTLTIADSAFFECSELLSVTIPDSVISIGRDAFCAVFIGIDIASASLFKTSLENITVDKNNKNYSSDEYGVLFNKDKTQLIQYPSGNTRTSYKVPVSVTSIGEDAFAYCKNLTSVKILNENCSIYDNESTIFSKILIKNSLLIFSGIQILAHPDSHAQAYAEKYDRTFIAYHDYTDATCTKAMTCKVCGETSGIKLGHTYTNSCDKSCNRCGETRAITHNYANATCTKAKTCKVCGVTSGKANGHNYADATCTKPKTCKVCKATTGSVNGHNYAAATCTKAKTCKICGATSGKANGHKYTNACDTSCNTCKATRKIIHAYKDVITKATLTKNGKIEKKCSVCGKVKSTKTIAYAKTFALSETKFTYNGKVKTPFVTIVDSNGKALVNGTDYTVKYASGRKNVGQYTVTITMKGNYSGTKTLTFNILPSKTSKITATQTTTTLKATWNKVTGATGYKVELLNANGKVIKTVTTKNLTYTFTKLTAGTTYKVRVTAYKTISGKSQYSLVSTTLTTATKPATPTLKVTSTKKGVANFTWTNVAGENGYEVYYSTSKSSGFKSLASYKTNVAKGSKSKLTSGKTYYFKVRSFKKVGSTTVYGDWSKVVSVKVK